MNRLSTLRKAAGMEISDAADIAGVDFLEIAMAESGIGHVHYDVLVALTAVYDCELKDMYPSLEATFESLEGESIGDEELESLMAAPEVSSRLIGAGIDPGLDRWYAIVKLKSGNERRYRLSSVEYGNLRDQLVASVGGQGWFTFMADCRAVALRAAGVSELSFRTSASYAPFSSLESADEVLFVSPRSPRPEVIHVEPDGGQQGDGLTPFADFIEGARSGDEIPTFILTTDEDETFLNIDSIEVMEIPMGVLMPDLYFGDLPDEPVSASSDLQELTVMGRA